MSRKQAYWVICIAVGIIAAVMGKDHGPFIAAAILIAYMKDQE